MTATSRFNKPVVLRKRKSKMKIKAGQHVVFATKRGRRTTGYASAEVRKPMGSCVRLKDSRPEWLGKYRITSVFDDPKDARFRATMLDIAHQIS